MRSAKGLKEAGVNSDTLQAYLTKPREPSESFPPGLYCLGESSLASGR